MVKKLYLVEIKLACIEMEKAGKPTLAILKKRSRRYVI